MTDKTEFDEENAWCPDRCPITLRQFFMWMDHPKLGAVPTYGGPYDSYTIPEPDLEEVEPGTPIHDITFSCHRYDHDEGGWVDGVQDDGIRIIDQSDLVGLLDDAGVLL